MIHTMRKCYCKTIKYLGFIWFYNNAIYITIITKGQKYRSYIYGLHKTCNQNSDILQQNSCSYRHPQQMGVCTETCTALQRYSIKRIWFIFKCYHDAIFLCFEGNAKNETKQTKIFLSFEINLSFTIFLMYQLYIFIRVEHFDSIYAVLYLSQSAFLKQNNKTPTNQ